jgi:hypothetical protein
MCSPEAGVPGARFVRWGGEGTAELLFVDRQSVPFQDCLPLLSKVHCGMVLFLVPYVTSGYIFLRYTNGESAVLLLPLKKRATCGFMHP